MGIVIIDQHPHLLSAAALGNSYTTICLNLKDPTDVNKAGHLLLLHDEDKEHLSRLPVGHAIIKLQDRWHLPFLVRIPPVLVKKGAVTDEVLKQLSAGSLTLSALKRRLDAEERARAGSRTADLPLHDGAFALLQDIASHGDDGVQERYTRLGWSSDRGTKVKLQLLQHKLIEEARIRVGTTTRALLRITHGGRQMRTSPRASPGLP